MNTQPPLTELDVPAPEMSTDHQRSITPQLPLWARLLKDSVADPIAFVYGAFAWKEVGPNAGPDRWQVDVLKDVGDGQLTVEEALRIAVASGHGIGKSALIAWIILWFAMTRPFCNGVVTANTGKQLSGKTWRELGVWLQRIKYPELRQQWVLTATKLYQRDNERTWFVQAIEWSERNPEAFAGLHAEHVLVMFDEASNIARNIWETTEGAMTTSGAMWVVFGNPTRNEGAFFDCFHKMRHRWRTRQIDSRTARMTNKKQLEQWVIDYGEDSDFVRVRVRGVFPRRGSNQLIGHDIIEAAVRRGADVGELDPIVSTNPMAQGALVLGVDVARFGDDASSIWMRRGRYARRLERHYGIDTYQLAQRVAKLIDDLNPEKVFVDGTGVGGGVVDTLVGLGYGTKVYEVTVGTSAADDRKYFNLRSEIWCLMRDWLKAGATVYCPDQPAIDDFTGCEYYFDAQQRIQLEPKDDMKKRGLPSPDNADALSMTFAARVSASRTEDEDRYKPKRGGRSAWAA